MVGEASLVGRKAELSLIVERLDAATPAAFVLAGEAGVGKTRLAEEAAAQAEAMGQAIAHVVATKAAASIPLGAFAPLLPDDEAPSGERLAMLRRISEAIGERASTDRRLVLVVDDIHLLDEASAALVHQLVHTGACSLIASLRTPGAAPDPVTALWKDGLAVRIDLGPLDEAEVEALAAKILGGPLAGSTARRLWDASRGNALYLRELLHGAEAADALANDRGIWVIRQPLTAPPRLAELVSLRLAGLDALTEEVVDLLAVAGSLGLGLLESLTSYAAIEEAERLGLIEVTEDRRRCDVRLTHPLYGDVIRQRLPKSRLRRLWAKLADSLAATGARRREDLLRLARWQLDAGQGGDPELLGRAAKRAQRCSTWSSPSVWRAPRSTPAAASPRASCSPRRCSPPATTRRRTRCSRRSRRRAPMSPSSSRSRARAYNLGILMGDPEGALAVLADALPSVHEPLARVGLVGRIASIRLMAGEPAAALEAASVFLDVEDDALVSRGTFVASFSLAQLGRTAEALAMAERGLEAHRRATDVFQLAESQLVGASIGRLIAGDLHGAEADARTAYQACLEGNDREGLASFSLLIGLAQVAEGRLDLASRAFREGAAVNRDLQDIGALRWCLGGVALAEAMAGRRAPAEEAMAELAELRDDWMMVFEADLVDRGRAWTKVATGEHSAALRLFESAADQAAARSQRGAEAWLLHDIARLGAPQGVVARLEVLAAEVDGTLVALLARHAAALVQGSASALEEVANDFEQMGALLLSAEAASSAGAAYRAEGMSRQAGACARHSAELAKRCGDVDPPTLVRFGHLDELTARELEVAQLAANGESSKAIAARLYISTRTVDNHLQSAYSKLGVTGRDQLAKVLGDG